MLLDKQNEELETTVTRPTILLNICEKRKQRDKMAFLRGVICGV